MGINEEEEQDFKAVAVMLMRMMSTLTVIRVQGLQRVLLERWWYASKDLITNIIIIVIVIYNNDSYVILGASQDLVEHCFAVMQYNILVASQAQQAASNQTKISAAALRFFRLTLLQVVFRRQHMAIMRAFSAMRVNTVIITSRERTYKVF